MMQVEARPHVGEPPHPAARRPIRIVAPTASGRRWRSASRADGSTADALATALDPTHFAVFLATFGSR